MTDQSRSEPESGRRIFTSRALEADRELAFRAFSDPIHLAQWWGPTRFANTFREFDLRPGGARRRVATMA